MFALLDDDGDWWGYINLFAASSYTKFEVSIGLLNFENQTEVVFSPTVVQEGGGGRRIDIGRPISVCCLGIILVRFSNPLGK